MSEAVSDAVEAPKFTPVETIRIWHRSLHPRELTGTKDHHPGDRAARARLRRSSEMIDVAMEPKVLELLRALRALNFSQGKDPQVLLLAVLLATVPPKSHSASFARQLGQGGPEAPVMSLLRFHALMRTLIDGVRTDEAGLFSQKLRALRRAVQLIKGVEFNVDRFIGDLLYFDQSVARRWAYDYANVTLPHRNAQTAPEPDDTSVSEAV